MRNKGIIQPLFLIVILIILIGSIGVILVYQGKFVRNEEPVQDQNRETDLNPEDLKVDDQKVEEPEPDLEKILLPTSGFCGRINQTALRDADYPKLLTSKCNLSLIAEKDESFLELKHYISAGPNRSDAILISFDVIGVVDPSKVVSSKIYLENVFCSGSVMIRHSSNEAYKKLANYGASEGDFAYNCGQGTPKKIETIQLDSDIIDGKLVAVIAPYSAVYPFQVDQVYLKITHKP